MGGNIAALAARSGWASVLVDGCARDVHELAACKVGICAVALMPLPAHKRQTGQRNIAVQVQGVAIAPGQWLYADEDVILVCAHAESPGP